MVGTTGFEPATSRTPSVRATRLRYVPTVCSKVSVSLAFEKGQDSKKFLVKIEQKFALLGRSGTSSRRRDRTRSVQLGVSPIVTFALQFLLAASCCVVFDVGVARQKSARAGDSEAFVVEQALNLENSFDVLAAIQAMATGAFHRLQRGEFGLPVTKNEGLGCCEPAHFTDAEKSLFRKLR